MQQGHWHRRVQKEEALGPSPEDKPLDRVPGSEGWSNSCLAGQVKLQVVPQRRNGFEGSRDLTGLCMWHRSQESLSTEKGYADGTGKRSGMACLHCCLGTRWNVGTLRGWVQCGPR